jgi:ABC-2 type transport system permease protein
MNQPTGPTDAQLIELCSKLPSHDREGQIFWRLRLQTARAHLNFLLANARLRTGLVVGLSLFFWFGLFALFYKGFDFVVRYVESPGSRYHSETMLFVFPLFFLSLQVMLIFSSGIILYGGLYPSRETAFLMTLPVRDERLVFYRFQEALLFSSWGFFLLASPMLLAYGMVTNAPWYYFAYLLPLMASFAYIPCTIGAILCLLLIYRLPSMRRIAVGVVAVAIIVVAYQSIWKTLEFSETEFLGNSWFKDTLKRFRFARGEWLPSTWLSNALIEAVRESPNNPRDLPWLEAGKYLMVLVSNALALHLIFMWLGKRVFRPAIGSFTPVGRKSRS